MNPKFSAGLNIALALFFGAAAFYTFIEYKEVGSSVLLLASCVISIALGLKYLKKLRGLTSIDPYLIKDESDQPIVTVDDDQLGIKKINNLALTPEQQSFINHYSIGAYCLGMLYYIFSGLTKEGLKQLIPIYGDIQELKALNWGRKIVWESIAWKDFETYKRKQIYLDIVGSCVITVTIAVVGITLAYQLYLSVITG